MNKILPMVTGSFSLWQSPLHSDRILYMRTNSTSHYRFFTTWQPFPSTLTEFSLFPSSPLHSVKACSYTHLSPFPLGGWGGGGWCCIAAPSSKGLCLHGLSLAPDWCSLSQDTSASAQMLSVSPGVQTVSSVVKDPDDKVDDMLSVTEDPGILERKCS